MGGVFTVVCLQVAAAGSLTHLIRESLIDDARLLIAQGADVNATGKASEDTPIVAAARTGWDPSKRARKPGFDGLIDDLLRHGAARTAGPAMLAAIENRDAALLRRLAGAGAREAKAFAFAVEKGNREAAAILMEFGEPAGRWRRIQYGCYRLARLQASWVAPLALLVAFFANRIRRRPALRKRPPPATGDGQRRLEAVACARCGGAVPMTPHGLICASCGVEATPPAEYGAALRKRQSAYEQTQKARQEWTHFKKACSTPRIVALVLLGATWLALSATGFFSIASAWTAPTLLLSATASLVIVASSWLHAAYLARTKPLLPLVDEFGSAAEGAGTVPCKFCKGPVAFTAGLWTSICGYCGAESCRVLVVLRATEKGERMAAEQNVSLYNAMADLSERRREVADSAFRMLAVAILLMALLGLTAAIP